MSLCVSLIFVQCYYKYYSVVNSIVNYHKQNFLLVVKFFANLA